MEPSLELRPKYVTQDEATAMMELWSRLREQQAATSMLTLQDVAEALHISPEEASQLLTMVRRQTQVPQAPVTQATVESATRSSALLAIVITPTIIFCGLFLFYWLMQWNRGFYVDGLEKACVWFSCVWLAFWLRYYRRPIGRALALLFNGTQ